MRAAAVAGDANLSVTELAPTRPANLPSEHVGHQLHAVADAEHGDAKLEERGIAPGGSLV